MSSDVGYLWGKKMKQDKKDNNRYYEFVKGSVVGSLVTVAATPGLYWTNQRLSEKPFVFRRCYTGFNAYLSGVVPVTALTFFVKNHCHSVMDSQQVAVSDFTKQAVSSVVGGAFSGVLSVTTEGLAQNKQALQDKRALAPTTWKLLLEVGEANGYKSLFRGGLAAAVREGSFAAGYFALTPKASEMLQLNFSLPKWQADLVAASVVGASVGLFSMPMQRLRYAKQENLTVTGKPKTYLQIVKSVVGEGNVGARLLNARGFFKAGLPRSFAAACGTFAGVKANQLLLEYESKGEANNSVVSRK